MPLIVSGSPDTDTEMTDSDGNTRASWLDLTWLTLAGLVSYGDDDSDDCPSWADCASDHSHRPR